jgi:hypothetical protein
MAGMTDPTAVQFTTDTAVPRSTLAADTTALVDGTATAGATSSKSEAETVGRWAGGVVVGAVVLLWLLGGIVFRSARIA